jgi:hypothetical protein
VAGLIDVFALAGHAAADVGVMVPVVVVDLDEAHAALDESAGHEHAVGKAAGLLGFLAVEFVDVLGLLGDVGQLRHAGLHAEGHLVLLNARVRFGIADFLVVDLVEGVEAFDGALAHAVGHAGRVVDEENGVAFAAEAHAGVLAGQIAAGPEARGDGLLLLAIRRRGDEHDEGGQVLVHRAEAVRSPGTEAGTAHRSDCRSAWRRWRARG